MSIDLTSMSKKELLALKARVEKAIERLERKTLEQARKAAEEAARKFGVTLDELTGTKSGAKQGAKSRRKGSRKGSGKRQAKAPAKYANPDDPSQTWTGRGRQPAWFKQALAAGKAPEDMLIDKG